MSDRIKHLSLLAKRGIGLRGLALSVFCIAAYLACTQDIAEEKNDYPGIAESVENLTAITGTCTFPKGSSTLDAVTMALVLGDGDNALVQKGSDGSITVNGYACDDGTGTPTSTNVKRLEITSPATPTHGNSVILDYSSAYYVLGASTNANYGTFVTLDSGQTNSLKIKGLSSSTTGDTITMGKAAAASTYGINLGTDKYVDVTPVNVDSFVVSLGPGNDTFSAAGQSDITAMIAAIDLPITVYGGAGNDTFNEGSAAPTPVSTGEVIYGNEGTDIVDYSSRTTAVAITVNAGTTNDGESAEKDDIKDIDTVKGGSGNDTLTQDPALSTASTIYGNGGNDTITGGLGNDTYWGGAGDDTFLTLTTVDGNDTVHGDSGTDTMSYAGRTADLTVVMDGTTASGDVTVGSEADKIGTDVESLIGGSGDDALSGNALNNTIRGGDGDDTFNGLAGDDTFVEEATGVLSGDDVFNGGAGSDTVTYAARTAGGEGVTVSIDNAADSGKTSGGETDTLACDVENLVGTAQVDILTGHTGTDCTASTYTQDNIISGGLGNDTITGGAGDDILDGEGGTDTIACGAGVDICMDGSTDCASATACEM